MYQESPRVPGLLPLTLFFPIFTLALFGQKTVCQTIDFLIFATITRFSVALIPKQTHGQTSWETGITPTCNHYLILTEQPIKVHRKPPARDVVGPLGETRSTSRRDEHAQGATPRTKSTIRRHANLPHPFPLTPRDRPRFASRQNVCGSIFGCCVGASAGDYLTQTSSLKFARTRKTRFIKAFPRF